MNHDNSALGPPGHHWNVSAAGLTHRGRVRENNEDSYALAPGLGLYLVSDGMGGVRAGEVASAITARTLPLHLERLLKLSPPAGGAEMAALLGEAITALNDELLDRSSREPAWRGAGATVVACWFSGGRAALAHMGDSRAYRLRDGRLERLTRDHTVVNLLLEMGKIDKREARRHPGIHILTRHVGMQPTALPETAALEVEAGDRLLLCSDGLWGAVRDKRLEDLLGADLKLSEICQEMITAANAAGGPDNITALVIQVNSRD
jgi:PPM family protein phosphatase